MAERQSKESIMAQVEAAAASAAAMTKLAEEETRRRSAQEKFVKMKDVYQKLRDEHINLIRGVFVYSFVLHLSQLFLFVYFELL